MTTNLTPFLTPPKMIAVVGLSDMPDRASHLVASYLQEQGFTIIPVNPNLTQVLGEMAYPAVSDIPSGIQVDIVQIFRQADQVLPILTNITSSGRRPLIWLQEGVGSPAAEAYARSHNLEIVMDRCMMKEHQKIFFPNYINF